MAIPNAGPSKVADALMRPSSRTRVAANGLSPSPGAGERMINALSEYAAIIQNPATKPSDLKQARRMYLEVESGLRQLGLR